MGGIQCLVYQLMSSFLEYVTLHWVSGNKVNARTRHVIKRSHDNGINCENSVLKYITYIQNISGNAEDLLSYPKVVIKKKKYSRQITALSLRIFTRNSMSTACFTGSGRARFKHMNYFFKLIPTL